MNDLPPDLKERLQAIIASDEPAGYIRACRLISEATSALAPLRVGFLSTFTISLLDPYLKVNAALAGFYLETYFAAFQQLEQEALNPASELYMRRPDIVVIATLLEDISPLRDLNFHTISPAQIENASESVSERFSRLREALRLHSSAHVIFFNFATPGSLQGGICIQQAVPGPEDFRHLCNRHLRSIASRHPGTSVFDLAELAFEIGIEHWHDARMWYLARQPISRRALARLATKFTRHLLAILKPRKKCLVLDLDNTLWGGILGEDGPGGIRFGDDFPGNAYKDFQRYLRMLREEGVLLAIASKNNPADVEEAFSAREDFPLSLTDFAVVEIHWGEKFKSISAIARKLSIGMDSVVFFDDNPAERASVEMNLPEVTVIPVPPAPELYISSLRAAGCFDQISLSTEDLRRSELYRVENERKALEAAAATTDAFLHSLEMRAEVAPVSPHSLGRCEQLLAKTNQFNLTSRRHSAQDVLHMIDRGGIALSLQLSDRFGDLGIVGVAIALPHERAREWEIDSFLLSCRVLGRAAESLFLAALLNEILNKGGEKVFARYVPTPKNSQTARFYPDHGFSESSSENLFELTLDTPVLPPEFFSITPQSK